MSDIIATTRKAGDYYKAVLIVPLDGRRQNRYESRDAFITKQTAQKQAEWWKYESKQYGQITPA